MDWCNPYSCKDWAEKFNLSFPLLDDSKGKEFIIILVMVLFLIM